MFGAGLTDFIITSGLVFIAATVFVECGFFAGFFLPGDSLLFLAGFIAGQGQQNIAVTIIAIFLAATLGNVVGYRVGQTTGPRLFNREEGVFFQKSHILQAQHFYAKHGGKTLILARFVPVMRTFAPLVAGIGSMSFRRFFLYSTVGAAIWAALIPLLGFWAYRVLGHSISIEKYIIPVVFGVTILSISGSIIHAIRESIKSKSQKKIDARELAASQAEAEQQID